ncbi:phosphoglucomutase [Acetoanaerobium pronyense]|uniref:Phosphoglucomutase n=1 Tax=Acetoanaerobium pronyense TaxID=1482736 RepID=A0ABS4KGA8_9FIRM|nr:phospho-sugar mutase [Acetoanaerobium pronyense]MBP2026819.1 phosphoglucomutase [Acetoanaerobium pronyense]
MELYMKNYEKWVNDSFIDEKTKKELEEIKDNKSEIEDRFYQDLEFGTAGLRGKIGAGTNRMNEYVIARATQAFANVINKHGEDFAKRGIAIAYDCRLFSPEFAKQTALVMAANGIKAYLFESLRPTPELSYAVRYYNCSAGVNITASHNPKDYNGYKAYWQEGSQIKSDIANMILEEISKIESFSEVSIMGENEALKKGLLEYIGKEVDDSYINEVKGVSIRDKELDKSIKIIYTPLNGAGNIPVRRVLSEMGYENVFVVKEQEQPDGTFPTIEYPNPEDLKAFEYAEKLADEVDGELLIATDPDCDRLAVQIRHNGKITPLNGNQTGVILINYILSSLKEKNRIPENPVIVKSIVTGDMGTAIAKDYGVEMINVLTGFKNICALPNEYDKTKEKNFIMGYEESIGYAIGTFVRDKDAVSASLMLAEAAAFYKAQNKTLIDVLNDLFEKYGYYQENTISLVLEGIEGQKRIKRMMEQYREKYPNNIGSSNLMKKIDYEIQISTDISSGKESKIDIEKTDALKFLFDDGCWYALRPSGTEPKIKLYVYSKANTLELAQEKLKEFEKDVLEKLHSIE